jgi:hypothetical protein
MIRAMMAAKATSNVPTGPETKGMIWFSPREILAILDYAASTP